MAMRCFLDLEGKRNKQSRDLGKSKVIVCVCGSRCSKGFVVMGARERCASRQTLRRRKECFEEREECLKCLDDKERVCGCEGEK